MNVYRCPACGTLYAKEPKRCVSRPYGRHTGECGTPGDQMSEEDVVYPEDDNAVEPSNG